MPSPEDVAGEVFYAETLGMFGIYWHGREILGRWLTRAKAEDHLERLRMGAVEPRYLPERPS